MADGFPNRPKILRGAFVEYPLGLPPNPVVFQFNPVEVTRSRSLRFEAPRGFRTGEPGNALRNFHLRHSDLEDVRDLQDVSVAEEAITFEIRLDASDDLSDGNEIAEQFGISPRLAALELMVQPAGENVVSKAVDAVLGSAGGFSFTNRSSPPLVLFIWGRKRVLPVNINALTITETEYSADLNPVRAIVAVQLTVIEGENPPMLYTGAMKEAMAAINLANIGEARNAVIPG
jgi:hypothetical protein